MQQWMYDGMIRLYRVGIGIAALFSSKARSWVSGRKIWEQELGQVMQGVGRPVVWVHAASVGEFEQGRPLMEGLREQCPEVFILLTFFSPSGYELRKEYAVADHVMYLPLDTRKNAGRFISLARPAVALFIKYEFWFNHLAALKAVGSKVFLVSGRFHAGQGFFKSWGAWFRKGLSSFDHFYLQDQGSAQLLDGIGEKRYTVNGDTRFDRVVAIKESSAELPDIADFVKGRPCVVLGSSWPQEELRMLEMIKAHGDKGFCTIIAPHEIDQGRIADFIRDCPSKVARYSQWQSGTADVLIIDSIGILSRVYRYGSMAFVGGAYGAGLHNVLEPAVWSIPVFFGPRYESFPEALGLVDAGGALSVDSLSELEKTLLELLENTEKRLSMGADAGRFCMSHKGASQVILSAVVPLLKTKS